MVKVITGVTLCVCLLYMLMGIVASGVMPVSEGGGKAPDGRCIRGTRQRGGCMHFYHRSLPRSFDHNTEFKFHLVFKFSDRGM